MVSTLSDYETSTYDDFLNIGGIRKNPYFQVCLNAKKDNSFVNTKITPYLINIEEHKSYPRVSLIMENTIKMFDVGVELNGFRYVFDEKMSLIRGEMETDSGLYIPLSLSKYSIGDYVFDKENLISRKNLNYPIMGLDGTIDRNPLFLLYPNETDNEVIGFMIQEGCLNCFNIPLNTIKEKNVKSSQVMINLSNSMLNDRIRISRRNLEGRVNHNFYVKREFNETKKDVSTIDWKNPQSVVEYLDDYIAEQEEAKKVLAIALKKYRTRIETEDETIEKGNVLLMGPSGTGKTYMMSLLAKGQKIPFVTVKATAKSTTGYVGENLSSSVFKQLLTKMKIGEIEVGKIYKPNGIIFIDEMDKLCHGEYGTSMSQKLQQEIVGWAEDDIINVDLGTFKSVLINTKNLLFVGAGAFEKIEGRHESLFGIADKRRNPNRGKIGFNNHEEFNNILNFSSSILEEDLEKYGLMPELIGRFTERAIFNSLSLESLSNIFHKVKNSTYSSYKKIIECEKYVLEMDDEVPMIIAQRCSKETGARAIKSIAAQLFNEIIYSPERFKEKDSNIIRLTPELVIKLLDKKIDSPVKNNLQGSCSLL